MTGPGGARGKALALALLAAALLAAWGLAVEPLIQSYVDQDERIAKAGNLLARYHSLTAATPALRAQLAELEARRQGRSDLLEAASDTLAAAGLQSRLQALFERHGAVQRSLQALPAVATGELLAITVRAQFTAEGEALARILYELETGRPVLFVDALDVRRKQSRRRRRNDAAEAGPEAAGPLDVRIDLVGYMRPGGEAGPP